MNTVSDDTVRFRLSGLNSWHDCQRRVAAGSFVEKIVGLEDVLQKENNQIGSSVGTACHAGVESLLLSKLEGLTPNVRHAQEFAIETLKEQLQDSEIAMDNETSNINEAIQQVAQITKIYEKYVLPFRDPKIIEDRFNFIAGRVEFSGQLDLQLQNGDISDLKTSKKLGIYFPQLGGYSIAMKRNGKEVGEHVEIVHIPRLKLKKDPYARVVKYNTSASERVALSYMMQIQDTYERFLDDNNPDIFKANPSSTICSDKYCRAYGTDFCCISKNKPKIYDFMRNE